MSMIVIVHINKMWPTINEPSRRRLTFNTTNNETDSATTHDYTDPQLTDPPYTQSTFNTDYYDITDFSTKFS